MREELQPLLLAISPEAPSGADLEYDADFARMESLHKEHRIRNTDPLALRGHHRIGWMFAKLRSAYFDGPKTLEPRLTLPSQNYRQAGS